MTTPSLSQEAVRRATDLLRANGSVSEAAAAISGIQSGDPLYGQAQNLRAVCAFRAGDLARAKDLLLEALENGYVTAGVLLSLAHVAGMLGAPQEALKALLAGMKRISPEQLMGFTTRLAQTSGFSSKQKTPANDRIFENLMLPLLAALLERGDMENALRLEGLLYELYVKATETEAHLAWCMERIGPLFTKAGHAWREKLPPLAAPALEPPYKVGFFIHNASMLAHIEVLLNTLKGFRMMEDLPFEHVVYCFGGKSAPMEEALRQLNVRLVTLSERFPDAAGSNWQRLLRLRELLVEEGVQELVWVSLVTMMPLAFSMRIAPVQTWFAMKYRNFSHDEIDGYVSGSALTRFGTLGGRRWRTGILGVDDWYDEEAEPKAAEIRASLGDKLVLMTLARTEKMTDPAYLRAVTALLVAHPQTIFLWAGREEEPAVVRAFRDGGVLDRTRFIGWVNTRLFAQVADVFLDTFPFPCGFTLYQSMAAGKPVVIYDSPEAAQTGLWSFLKPVIEGQEGGPDERAELMAFVGQEDSPLISLARTPEEYVALAGRLITDASVRDAAGEASRRFMARYFSDPRSMGESFARHFVEVIEERRALLSA